LDVVVAAAAEKGRKHQRRAGGAGKDLAYDPFIAAAVSLRAIRSRIVGAGIALAAEVNVALCVHRHFERRPVIAAAAEIGAVRSGATDSTNFPVVNALQTEFADGMAGANLNDAFIAEFGSGLIGKVTPALGGTFGSTTVTLSGAGFEPGATAELSSGGSSVASGQFVKVSTDGATLRTTFDLSPTAWRRHLSAR